MVSQSRSLAVNATTRPFEQQCWRLIHRLETCSLHVSQLHVHYPRRHARDARGTAAYDAGNPENPAGRIEDERHAAAALARHLGVHEDVLELACADAWDVDPVARLYGRYDWG